VVHTLEHFITGAVVSHPEPIPTVRAVGPEEAGALAAFADRLFHETYAPTCRAEDVIAYRTANFTVEELGRELRDPRGIVLLVEVGGALAGYAQLRLGPPPPGVEVEAGQAAVEIARFYVDAPWHGRGVAQAMMRAVRDAAVEHRAGALWLTVWEHNPRAQAFYRKLGFRVVGAQTFVMGEDVQHDHVMTRGVDPLP